MNASIKRSLTWFAVFVIAIALMSTVTQLALDTDEALPIIERFLAESPELAERTGGIKSIRITKKVTVSEGSYTRAHRVYTLDVRGEKASTTVEVKLEMTADKEIVSLEIIH